MTELQKSEVVINLDSLVRNTFENAVILDIILSYLRLKDLKKLRLVSHSFSSVWMNKSFLKRALVSGFDTEAMKSGLKWKNLRIHLNTNIREKETLAYLLKKEVEFLWLTGNGVHLKEFVVEEENEDGKSTFKRLTHLKTNTTTLNGFKIQDFLGLAENLKILNVHLNVKCARLEEMSVLFNNLRVISEKSRKLTEFKLTYYNFRNPDVTWKEIQKLRTQILRQNAKTINSVELEAVSDVDELGGVVFSSLKNCTLRGPWTVLTPIFLKNQPFLENFQFDCSKGYSPVSVLQTVAEVSKSFKKLIINGNGFNTNDDESSPWKFLSQIQTLESIQVVEGGDHQMYPHLWPNFPASLISIRMSGVKRISGQPTISMMSNFPFRSLTELELFSGNQIDDQDLQQICRKLGKLQVLKFSSCSHCTDYGITGIPLGGKRQFYSEISIRHLKELRKLTINHCDQITNGIESFITFPLLTELDLRENRSLKATSQFKESIRRQNACLELLHV